MIIADSSSCQIYRFPVGPMQTNCYFLVDISSKNTIIIDPGAEGDVLSDQLFTLGLHPLLIFLTHGHADHVGGLLPLVLNFHVPIFLNKKDFFLYQRAPETITYFTHLPADPIIPTAQIISPAKRDTLLATFPTILTPLPCPGHTPGQTALYLPDEHWFFGGDLIFADGIGRTDFAYAQPKSMAASLQHFHALGSLTVFPGHGEFFST